PAERVLAVRYGGAGCRLSRGLAHGSAALVSEVIAPGGRCARLQIGSPAGLASTTDRIKSEPAAAASAHLVRAQDCLVLVSPIHAPLLSAGTAASVEQFRQRQSQKPPTTNRRPAATGSQGSYR